MFFWCFCFYLNCHRALCSYFSNSL